MKDSGIQKHGGNTSQIKIGASRQNLQDSFVTVNKKSKSPEIKKIKTPPNYYVSVSPRNMPLGYQTRAPK